jgi:hypothetical protein
MKLHDSTETPPRRLGKARQGLRGSGRLGLARTPCRERHETPWGVIYLGELSKK